ncbi:MAG: hypothetical protein K9H16_11705 [Bacteroidales bacterium]|nr:hypothetical protein [Bacteroidales bacterium]
MPKSHHFIDKLKRRWDIHSTWQVVIILVVFSCTGFSVLYFESLIHNLLNIPGNLEWYYSMLLFIVITLPLYNILLLIYGFIFGQFRFFWNFEKKFFARFTRLFTRKTTE